MTGRITHVRDGAGMPQGGPTTDAARLFHEVQEHCRRCFQNPGNISDIWSRILEQRGNAHSIDVMLGMLEPGNPINARVRDVTYLIDATAIDVNDPAQTRLLAIGESDFGRPRREIPLGNTHYSSAFLNNVALAGDVIGAIERAGIANPRIMEIGGGLGLLAGALWDYYGERATIYCVDIPEMLMVQEWFLRNRFPDAATGFRPSTGAGTLVVGGINFINAYVLAANDVALDVAVTINAMQGMKAEVADSYIRYVERNVAVGGVFYFRDTTGLIPSSAAEPTEYDFDGRWEVASTGLAYQIDTCLATEELRLVLVRTVDPEDSAARRLALRLIWNGMLSGDLESAGSHLETLRRLPRQSAAARRRAIEGLGTASANVDAVSSGLHFPQQSFRKPFAALSTAASAEARMRRMWDAQARLIGLMRRTSGEAPALAAAAIADESATLCRDLDQGFGSDPPARSEYWTAYIASFLLPLGSRDAALARLSQSAARSRCAAWLVRFAHLFAAYGFAAEALETLAKMERADGADPALALKGAEIAHACGESERALDTLTRVAGRVRPSSALGSVLAKTAARLGHPGVVRDVCTTLADDGAAAESALLDILWFAVAALSVDSVREIHDAVEKRFRLGTSSSAAATYGRLLVRLGRNDEGRRLLDQAVAEFADSFFRLGWLGKLFQDLGDDARADACFERSLEIRQDNFTHHEFIANAYLSGSRWREAAKHFERAAELKPHLRHIQGRAAYCRLPAAVRDGGAFGRPHELAMVFQRDQRYYHDTGLQSK